MEEILASIRRIIEESDTTRHDEVPPLPVNSDVPPAATTTQAPPAQPIAIEEAELPPREGIAVAPPVAPSFESALRRPAAPPQQPKFVERGAARTITSYTEKLRQFAKEPIEDVVAEPAATTDNLEAGVMEAIVEETQAPLHELPAAVELDQPQLVVQPVEFAETQIAADTELPGEQPDAGMDDAVSLDLERALDPILSEATERQVSSAFEDLSFAIRNEQRRSFDEIAQEIMRPLLQDWLDNNLPTLVERLVREEIERVARGGRR